MSQDFRTTVLCSLQQRNRQAAQFERIIQSCHELHNSVNSLAAQNSKYRGMHRNASVSEGPSGLDQDTDKVITLQSELDRIYRLKAINDQDLIDARKRVDELQKELSSVTSERDDYKSQVEILEKRLQKARTMIVDLENIKHTISDENTALHMTLSALEQKYMTADSERCELIDRLKNYKMMEIEAINKLNDAEAERVKQKKQSLLADAIADLPPIGFEVLGVDGAEPAFEASYDSVPNRCMYKAAIEASEIHDVMWHASGNSFFTAGNDKKIVHWNYRNDMCTQKATYVGCSQTVTRIDIDSDNRYLLGASADHSIRLWTLEDQRLRTAFTGHTDKVSSARFAHGSRQILSGSNDRTLKTWDVMTGRCLRTYFPGSIILDVSSNDRSFAPLISSHCDRKVRFWDTRDNAPCRVLECESKVTSICNVPDGNSILMMSRDDTLNLFDLRRFEIEHSYSTDDFRIASDTSRCCISPNGSYVAAGSSDGRVFVWDTLTTKLQTTLPKNLSDGGGILSVAWHPQGRRILSGDRKKQICVWG
uniref:ATG16 domain-containing protein n=1 Tax=Panagrellus redivivus TaxID=6233 RepID=A0A7E4W6A7_PANRE